MHPGGRAAKVIGLQYYSLYRRGRQLGVIQRQRFALIEDLQIVPDVAGQLDHVEHQQNGTPTTEALAGGGFQFAQCRGDDDGRQYPVLLGQLPGCQQTLNPS